MGGLAGHMMHLYDDPELTFFKLKKIMRELVYGKLTIAEKIDGINTFLGYDKEKGFTMARNKGDLLQGGMSVEEIQQKEFKGGGNNIKKAFVDVLNILNAYRRYPNSKKYISAAFRNEDNSTNFYNCEVVSPNASNIIYYSQKSFIVHKVGHATVIDGKPQVYKGSSAGIYDLIRNISNSNIPQQLDWTFSEDLMHKMEKGKFDNDLAIAINSVDKVKKAYNLQDSDTLLDYLFASLQRMVNDAIPGVDPSISEMTTNIMIGRMKVRDIPKNIDPAILNKIKMVIQNRKEYGEKAMWPLEMAIHQFSSSLIEGMNSKLITDPAKERVRLQKYISKVVQKIQDYQGDGKEYAQTVLRKQLAKLRDVSQSAISMEGIVFQYGDRTYKLTGNFAPINQLAGLYQYGRGNIVKPLKQTDKMEPTDDEQLQENERQPKVIALFPGAFKPPHIGHLGIVMKYASEVDELIIFMSPLPRTFSSEEGARTTIDFAKAAWLWEQYIKFYDLSNVSILESPVNSPVGAVYQFVANQEDKLDWAQPGDKIFLLSSSKGDDQQRFSLEKIQKYARNGVNVYGEDVASEPMRNSEGEPISSSTMRKALADKDEAAFSSMIPQKLRAHATKIMEYLLS